MYHPKARLACSMEFEKTRTILKIRSNLAIVNSTGVELEIFLQAKLPSAKAKDGAKDAVEHPDELTRVRQCIPPGETYWCPLGALVDGTVRVRPAAESHYMWSTQDCSLHDPKRSLRRPMLLTCEPAQQDEAKGKPRRSPFSVLLCMDQPLGSDCTTRVSLNAPLVLENLLPVSLRAGLACAGPGGKREVLQVLSAEPGESKPIHFCHPTLVPSWAASGWEQSSAAAIVRAPTILVLEVLGHGQVAYNLADDAVDTLELQSSTSDIKVELEVIDHVSMMGVRRIQLFCKFWLVNLTELRVAYRGEGMLLASHSHDLGEAAVTTEVEDPGILEDAEPAGAGGLSETASGGGLRETASTASSSSAGRQQRRRVRPILFSPKKANLASNKIAMRVYPKTEWSEAFPTDSEPRAFSLAERDRGGSGKKFEIALNTYQAGGLFRRSTVIELSARIVVINNTGWPGFMLQQGTQLGVQLEAAPGSQVHWHWQVANVPEAVTLRMHPRELGRLDSYPICVTTPDRCFVPLYSFLDDPEPTAFVMVDIYPRDMNLFVRLSVAPIEQLPFVIDNDTKFGLHLAQALPRSPEATVAPVTKFLAPHTALPYTWRHPSGMRRLRVAVCEVERRDRVSEACTFTVELDKLTTLNTLIVETPQGPRRLWWLVSVGPRGARVLTVTHSMLKAKAMSTIERTDPYSWVGTFSMAGLVLSLFDAKPQELLAVTLAPMQNSGHRHAVRASFQVSPRHVGARVSIMGLRIDNQLADASYEALLLHDLPANKKPMAELTFAFARASPEITVLEECRLHVVPLRLRVDDALLAALLNFYMSLPQYQLYNASFRHGDGTSFYLDQHPPASMLWPLYVGRAEIPEIKVFFSYATSAVSNWWTDHPLGAGLMLARKFKVNVQDASLALTRPPVAEFHTTSVDTLTMVLQTHYATELLRSKRKLLFASLPLLGPSKSDSQRLHAIQSVQSATSVVSVWENERYLPLRGWDEPTALDRPHWSDVDGKHAAPRDATAPPKGYEWASPWQVDHDRGNSDRDGWSYAVNFVHSWHASKRMTDFVRRRKWIRTAKFIG